jgi:hypothetical protein
MQCLLHVAPLFFLQTSNITWKRNRNLYARLLLEQVGQHSWHCVCAQHVVLQQQGQ